MASKRTNTFLPEIMEVPDEIFKDTETLKVYFKQSFNYVSSLKPKASKK